MVSFDWTTRWGYLLYPTICIFGFLTNLINIIVLVNPKMKDISFKYLLAISISDLMYLGFEGYFLIDICSDCPLHTSYFTQIFNIFIDGYFTSCLAIFCILTDIFLSLIRYSTLKNKIYLQSLNYYLVLGFVFALALIYYLPVLFFYEILPIHQLNNNTNNNETKDYLTIMNSLGSSLFGTITSIILSTIRIILAMFILTGINIMNAIEFKKRFSNRVHNRNLNLIESK
jgi:hypothetical protein